MKAKIIATIKDNSIMPAKIFTAEEILDVPNSKSVLGKLSLYRQHFRNKFGPNIEIDIISCDYLH